VHSTTSLPLIGASLCWARTTATAFSSALHGEYTWGIAGSPLCFNTGVNPIGSRHLALPGRVATVRHGMLGPLTPLVRRCRTTHRQHSTTVFPVVRGCGSTLDRPSSHASLSCSLRRRVLHRLRRAQLLRATYHRSSSIGRGFHTLCPGTCPITWGLRHAGDALHIRITRVLSHGLS
jgi:hypothetical protein